MRDVTAIDALVGALMPLVIALINQAHWSPRVKGGVALGVCVLAAALTEVLRGSSDWRDWRNTGVVVFGAALFLYRTWWQPSGITDTVERATTFSQKPASR